MIKPKKSKFYFGADWSVIFFTDKYVNNAYPAFDIISDNFVGDLGIFLGVRFTNFLSVELESSYMFSQNSRNVSIGLNPPVIFSGNDTAFTYAHPSQMTLFSFPLLLNVKLLPFHRSKGFMKRVFIGGGAGFMYIHETYDDVVYSMDMNQVNAQSGLPVITNMTNNQWTPVFRLSVGFTGIKKPIDLGIELRYNFIALKKSSDPFITRTAQNFNNINLAGRLYFNL